MNNETLLQDSSDTPSKRRDFIRGSALTAGALAAASFTASASGATLSDKAQLLAVPKRNLDVTFGSTKVSRYDLQVALEKILDITGCPQCGLNGFDLRFRVDEIFPIEVSVPANMSMY